MKCKRCGACCKKIYIPYSPKQLRNNYMAWIKQLKRPKIIEDIFLIYPMLKYLSYNKKRKRYIYSCVHLNKEKGKFKCGIQKIKPRMCADFPYGRPSYVKDCGYNKKEN